MFTLTFTQKQMQVINAALNEIPFKHAAPLIAEINKQIQEQFNNKVDAGHEIKPEQ